MIYKLMETADKGAQRFRYA